VSFDITRLETMPPPLKMELNVGAAVPSGDVKSSVETANRRSGVSGRTSGSHIFIERGSVPRHEKLP